MKLIVGLGNPGIEYKNTRHNVGFMVLDEYLKDVTFINKFDGLYVKKIIDGEHVIFLKPMTYMNLSGNSVIKFKNFFKIDNENILVIRDDLDLAIGTSKIKFSSSSGGNNGIKSIINCLGNKDFGQYKIGISNNKNIDTKNYVLGKFSSKEKEMLDKQIAQSKDVINYFIKNGIEKTMSFYNGMLK